VSRAQAKAHIQIITAVLEEDMATKSDIKELELRMESFKNEILIKLGVLITFVVPTSVFLLQFL